MIKTLRITGVAAVAFAGVILASVLGQISLLRVEAPGSEKMEKILASAGAVDRFRELHTGDDPNNDTTPPLVKQAEAFKDIIDPKVVAPVVADAPKTPIAPRSGPSKKQEPTSQQFTLLGTACSLSDPSSSFAYIRSVDNTCQWVACGSEIGHFLIKEVREDSIVCWDGRRESVLTIEAVPDRVSLLESDGEAPEPAAVETSEPVEVKTASPLPNQLHLPGNRPVPSPSQVSPKLTTGERESLDDLTDKLRNLRGVSGDGLAADANRAAVEKLISELKSSRVSPEETKNLENLGADSSTEKQRAREEQKREFIRRLNSGRPLKN